MKIVWDEPKRQTNVARHGLDLADAESFDWEDALVVRGHAGADSRPRYRAVGWLRKNLVTVVFSRLGSEAVSVISLRPASRTERMLYAEK
ncbi:MAG TPA: BrnT family toxin [Xanthobacteraceae bacterium]